MMRGREKREGSRRAQEGRAEKSECKQFKQNPSIIAFI